MNRLIRILIFAMFIIAAPFSTFADTQLTLQWNTNPEADLAGYRLYLRTEGSPYDYDNFEWQGSESQCTVPALDENTVYYFVLRAFDQEDNETGDSNEVRYPPLDTSDQVNNSDQASPGGGSSFAASGGGCFIESLINR